MSVTSFSRLGSANAYDNSLRNLQRRQTDLANLQENLTTGKRITSAADDPTGAAQAERALNRIARIATDQRALEAQRNAIAAAEGTLGDITTALQSVRELLVSAGNGSHSPAERTTIAGQLSGLRDQILTLANAKDSNGSPLFAALGSALKPFVGPQSFSPDYNFDGLPGQSSSGAYEIPFTLDGESAFMHVPARDAVFNVNVSNNDPLNPTPGLISANRSLITDSVTVISQAEVANTAALTATYNASLPIGTAQDDYPTYTVNFMTLDSTTVPGTTTVTYDIVATPDVTVVPGPSGPITLVTGATASYPTGGPANIPIVIPGAGTGNPALSFNIKGTPPTTDKNGTVVVGSPAVGDLITIAPKRSVFSVIDTAITDIGKAANANAATQAVAQALHNIDISMARVSAVRGQAGDLLGRADRITDTNDKRTIEQEGNRSRAEDLDMIKGVSDFQNQQTGYSAALQSYAAIQKLSLFDFIR
ncbi:MAG: flagellar hook-associated protein FlgL [Rhodoferax sp.]|nr:flagellar hook-associated protein FlgL [Rhodoferax sp.]